MSTQYGPSSFATLEHMGRSEDLNQASHLVHKSAIALYRLAPVLEQLCQGRSGSRLRGGMHEVSSDHIRARSVNAGERANPWLE
jgi:hypothetical protein